MACLFTFVVYCADTAAIVLWPHEPGDGVPVKGVVGILVSAVVVVALIFWWMVSISLVEEPASSPLALDKPEGAV